MTSEPPARVVVLDRGQLASRVLGLRVGGHERLELDQLGFALLEEVVRKPPEHDLALLKPTPSVGTRSRQHEHARQNGPGYE